jgi:pyruvate/2-oxoglutarate dehydrogenase complex dihydrolipoamide dehydrogenase (E3) component
MGERILPREDPEFSELVAQRMRADGVELLTGHKAARFGPGKVLECENGRRVEFDAALCAVGRVARTRGYGLEELGIPLTRTRTIETNEFLQTAYPNIYACGDVAGPYQFTHVGAHQAYYAAANALFGSFWKQRADYSVVPWATFTDPEVARVGLNETEARQRGIAYEVSAYDLGELDRAIADGAAHGFVKVLTEPGRDRILGATIVGERAGDLIIEFIAAMKHGIGLNRILGTIHIYPTFAEANKYAAGAWKRAHAPARVLKALERFHAWMRG